MNSNSVYGKVKTSSPSTGSKRSQSYTSSAQTGTVTTNMVRRSSNTSRVSPIRMDSPRSVESRTATNCTVRHFGSSSYGSSRNGTGPSPESTSLALPLSSKKYSVSPGLDQNQPLESAASSSSRAHSTSTEHPINSTDHGLLKSTTRRLSGSRFQNLPDQRQSSVGRPSADDNVKHNVEMGKSNSKNLLYSSQDKDLKALRKQRAEAERILKQHGEERDRRRQQREQATAVHQSPPMTTAVSSVAASAVAGATTVPLTECKLENGSGRFSKGTSSATSSDLGPATPLTVMSPPRAATCRKEIIDLQVVHESGSKPSATNAGVNSVRGTVETPASKPGATRALANDTKTVTTGSRKSSARQIDKGNGTNSSRRTFSTTTTKVPTMTSAKNRPTIDQAMKPSPEHEAAAASRTPERIATHEGDRQRRQASDELEDALYAAHFTGSIPTAPKAEPARASSGKHTASRSGTLGGYSDYINSKLMEMMTEDSDPLRDDGNPLLSTSSILDSTDSDIEYSDDDYDTNTDPSANYHIAPLKGSAVGGLAVAIASSPTRAVDIPTTGKSATGTNLKLGGAATMRGSSSPNSQFDASPLITPRSQHFVPSKCGLNNLGNTCFMNSALQCLSHTVPLVGYFLSDAFAQDCNVNSRMQGRLIQAFSNLLRDMRGNSLGGATTPSHFKRQVEAWAPQFRGYQQHDAQEFCTFLLDGLHEELNLAEPDRHPPIRSEDYDFPPDWNAQKIANHLMGLYMRRHCSRIMDVFVGQLQNRLKCGGCGHMSIMFDPYWHLSLPIPAAHGRVRLEDCFAKFLEQETLTGDEKPRCDKCKERHTSTKQFALWSFPRILVIHLKRFTQRGFSRSKLSTEIKIPRGGILDLTPFSSATATGEHSENDMDAPLYRIYAACCHIGGLYSGHYIAKCRDQISGQWYVFSDSTVSPCGNDRGTDSVLDGSEPYLLFAERLYSDSPRMRAQPPQSALLPPDDYRLR
eukprot:Clim_evm7s161 gene=Clim_evmTU7s161